MEILNTIKCFKLCELARVLEPGGKDIFDYASNCLQPQVGWLAVRNTVEMNLFYLTTDDSLQIGEENVYLL